MHIHHLLEQRFWSKMPKTAVLYHGCIFSSSVGDALRRNLRAQLIQRNYIGFWRTLILKVFFSCLIHMIYFFLKNCFALYFGGIFHSLSCFVFFFCGVKHSVEFLQIKRPSKLFFFRIKRPSKVNRDDGCCPPYTRKWTK